MNPYKNNTNSTTYPYRKRLLYNDFIDEIGGERGMQNTVSQTITGGIQDRGAMRRKWQEVIKHKYFYLMVFPTVLFFLIFAYVPMYGVILAFKDFNYISGDYEQSME